MPRRPRQPGSRFPCSPQRGGGGGYPPVIGGAVVGESAPAVDPDHLNSAVSGLSPITCRACAGHGQNTSASARSM